METEGKLLHILPIQNIDTQKGSLKKLEFVIETKTKFPKKVCFTLWNDKAENFSFKPNDDLKVSFDLESRESKGRWFTEAKAWRVEKISANDSSQNNSGSQDFPPSFDLPPEPNELDDLPF
ncbi:MAG TPA: DUF3127 domain-containing protein [Bacteroidales bacterium]|nr:DUF3127 domain-containing protein [Bacteroidales bacterium]HPS18183.1 DUF3127 domain-containing protein [Bacteroidales bacterium]